MALAHPNLVLNQVLKPLADCPEAYYSLVVDWSDRLAPYWFTWEDGR